MIHLDNHVGLLDANLLVLLLLVICYKETCVLSLLLLSTTVMLSMTNASTYIGTNVPFQIGYYI